MGRAAAVELGKHGVRVFVADLNLAAAEETAQAIAGMKGQCEPFAVDVSSSESVSSLFRKLRDQAERLDLMVHSAAILGRTVFIEDMTD